MIPDLAGCDRLIARGPWTEDLYRHRCTPPIGPVNAWSNAAYALAGGVVLWQDWTARGFVMALCLMALAYGSWQYHSRKTLGANALDHVGMYLVFGALAVLAIDPPNPQIPLAMTLGAIAVAVVFTYAIPKASLDLIMGLFLGIAGLAAWLKGSPGLAAASMGVFVVSYGIWQVDRRVAMAMKAGTTPPLTPKLAQYGHGGWHVGTAVAIDLMVLALVAVR